MEKGFIKEHKRTLPLFLHTAKICFVSCRGKCAAPVNEVVREESGRCHHVNAADTRPFNLNNGAFKGFLDVHLPVLKEKLKLLGWLGWKGSVLFI